MIALCRYIVSLMRMCPITTTTLRFDLADLFGSIYPAIMVPGIRALCANPTSVSQPGFSSACALDPSSTSLLFSSPITYITGLMPSVTNPQYGIVPIQFCNTNRNATSYSFLSFLRRPDCPVPSAYILVGLSQQDNAGIHTFYKLYALFL